MNPSCPQCRYPLPVGGMRCPECGLDVQWQAISHRILPHARLLGTIYLFMAVMLVAFGALNLDTLRSASRADGLSSLAYKASGASLQFRIAWLVEQRGGGRPDRPEMSTDYTWSKLDDILRGTPGASRGSSTADLLRANMGDYIVFSLSTAICLLLSVACFRAHRTPIREFRVRWLPIGAVVLMFVLGLIVGSNAAYVAL